MGRWSDGETTGTFAQLTSREGRYCVIKLPSGETRQILSACKATVGSVGNSDHGLESAGKAGRSAMLLSSSTIKIFCLFIILFPCVYLNSTIVTPASPSPCSPAL